MQLVENEPVAGHDEEVVKNDFRPTVHQNQDCPVNEGEPVVFAEGKGRIGRGPDVEPNHPDDADNDVGQHEESSSHAPKVISVVIVACRE